MGSDVSGAESLTLEEDVLWRALVDWVSDSEVMVVARRSRIEDELMIRDLSMGLIAQMLVRGLVVAGGIGRDGFEQWECSTAEAIERIVRDWTNAPAPQVRLGEVVWLAATPAGEAIGEEVCKREGWC